MSLPLVLLDEGFPMDSLVLAEETGDVPPPRGPNVWASLDAFGHYVANQALEPALREAQEFARYNQIIHGNLDDSLIDKVLDVVGQMLEHLATSTSREFAVVHLWLLYSQSSPVADDIPAWLTKALEFFDGVPIQVQVHLLTVSLSWGKNDDERTAIERRLQILEAGVLAPGRVGHTRVVVFVITDRDHLAYKFSEEACWAAAGDFAAFSLLTDAPRSRAQAVGRAFLSPPAAQRFIASFDPRNSDDGQGLEDPDSVWGPFTSLAVAVRFYPVEELWKQRTASRQLVLDAILQEDVPWQWIPDLPELKMIDRDAIPPGQFCPEPPRWTPRHPFNRLHEEYAARDRMERWRELSKTWREGEPARFHQRLREIQNESASFRGQFGQSYEEATMRLLRDAPYDGLFQMLERFLDQCLLRINQASHRENQDGVASDSTPATSAASQHLDPPPIPDPTPFVREAQASLAAAIARRPDARMLAGVALISGTMSWYLIAQSLLFLQDSLLGWFDLLAARRQLPRLSLDRFESAFLLNPSLVRAVVAITVGLIIGLAWWWVRYRSRRHLEEVYSTTFEQPARSWCDESMATIDAALRESKVEHITADLAEFTAQIERRKARLKVLRAESSTISVPQWPSSPDPFAAHLEAMDGSAPNFHPTDARSVIRTFRTSATCIHWDDERVPSADFFAHLHGLAAMYLRDTKPALRTDLERLIGQIHSAMPTVDDILVLPAIGRDRTPPWAITRMLALPAGLERHPVLEAWGDAALPLPVEERIYLVALRQGLQLVDLSAPAPLVVAAAGGKP